MSNWLDKAKEAAMAAAESAKKAAQGADFGEMLDKTKNMALQAAEEAKKAADYAMSKTSKKAEEVSEALEPESLENEDVKADVLTNKFFVTQDTIDKCNTRIAKIETLLQEIKALLSK